MLKNFSWLIQSDRLAHAYLLAGPEGIGKLALALDICRLINCENKTGDLFCGECPSCQKITKGNHPDIHIVDNAVDETIKIDQVRSLILRVQLKPYEAKKAVVIFNHVENLTKEGANALLKTLEEPSRDTIIILCTPVFQRVLATIRSRCHIVRLAAQPNERLAYQLRSDYAIDEQVAHFLAYFSEGSLGEAQEMAKKKVFQKKNKIIDELIFSVDSEAYLKKLLADKENTKEALKILLSWFRDLILLKSGIDSELIHSDRLNELKEEANGYTFEEIEEIIRQLTKTIKMAEDNFNIKIAMSIIKEKICRRLLKSN